MTTMDVCTERSACRRLYVYWHPLNSYCRCLLVHCTHTHTTSNTPHTALTLTFFPSISTVRTLKSTPMVFCCFSEKIPDLKFWTTQVFPTLESPIRMILKRKSKKSSCSGPGVCMVDAQQNVFLRMWTCENGGNNLALDHLECMDFEAKRCWVILNKGWVTGKKTGLKPCFFSSKQKKRRKTGKLENWKKKKKIHCFFFHWKLQSVTRLDLQQQGALS